MSLCSLTEVFAALNYILTCVRSDKLKSCWDLGVLGCFIKGKVQLTSRFLPCRLGAGLITQAQTLPLAQQWLVEIQAARLHPPVDVHPEMVCKRTLCLCSSSQLSCPFMSNSKEEAVCASQPSLPITSPAFFSIAAQDLYILSSFPDLFFCPPSPSIIHLSHTQASHSLHAVGLRDAPSPSAPPHPPCPTPH